MIKKVCLCVSSTCASTFYHLSKETWDGPTLTQTGLFPQSLSYSLKEYLSVELRAHRLHSSCLAYSLGLYSQALELHVEFYESAGDSKSSPHTCTATTLPTETSHQFYQ